MRFRVLPLILFLTWSRLPWAFGDRGGFEVRVLETGSPNDRSAARERETSAAWAAELVGRTSASARSEATSVRADSPELAVGPFLYWHGNESVAPLSGAEIAGLRKFFSLGGFLLVDDVPEQAGAESPFGRSARAELARVMPASRPIELPPEHVLFRSYYFMRRAEGRLGHAPLSAIVQNGFVQVVFASVDLGGALARNAKPHARDNEQAIRLAVNIAMYVLCSNYKDDQVHAPFLMRKRVSLRGP